MTVSLEEQLKRTMAAGKRNVSRKLHKEANTNASDIVSQSRDHSQNSVVKSNELARAYYKVTLNEKRLMELLISRVHPQRNDNDFQSIEITAKMFCEAFGISRQNSFTYLVKAAHGLQDVAIWLKNSDGTGDRFGLIGRVIDDRNKASVTCTVLPWVVPHLIGLQGRFTKYTLQHGAEFKAASTWRIFELLLSWSNSKKPLMGTKIVQVDDLRARLKTPNSYPFSMFKRRVLVMAQTELKELLNINLDIEYIKTSRKITGLKFTYFEDEQGNLPLGGGKTIQKKSA